VGRPKQRLKSQDLLHDQGEEVLRGINITVYYEYEDYYDRDDDE